MIKPIETKYKGYCFRSRLEARWAVFFDALGVEWQYEQEGLDLTDAYQKRVDFKPLDPGQRVLYLPDFYLPQQRKYVEIKPYGGANWWGDGYPLLYEKIVLLGGLLVHGVPGTIDDRTYEICVEGDTDCYFGYCPHCHAFGAGYCSWAERICPDHMKCDHHNKQRLDDSYPMLRAIEAARSARFEYN